MPAISTHGRLRVGWRQQPSRHAKAVFSMPIGVYPRQAPEVRFWENVQKTETCWVWIGGRTHRGLGYGSFYANGQRWQAHRYSWELHNGPIPVGMWVLHHCDNPPCIRPDHLFIGTVSDNARDCASKHRMNMQTRPELFRGERHGRAKLRTEDVIAIRERFHQQGAAKKALAREYGVNDATIRRVISGANWGHVHM